MRTVKSEYYYENGNKYIEEYRLNGELHNPNGIAYKNWYRNGNICTEAYILNDKYHRENGIALKRWYSNGNKWSESYWINGKYLTKEEFENRNNSSCSGKVVEIDGKKYKLNEIKD